MSDPLHYSFADAIAVPPDQRRALLGGKGASLARMTAMGLRVPPGFTLTTAACRQTQVQGWSDELDHSISKGIAALEETTGRALGSAATPLLVSVRSGAPRSMPGMMDTVLNVGMTDAVAVALAEATGDAWFAWDTARRFVQSYGSIVLGVPDDVMATISDRCLGSNEGRDLAPDALAAATADMRSLLRDEGYTIPTEPLEQVCAAVAAVFASWSSDRARTYRAVEDISDDLGTAATIQMMTFGNLGDRSGTGVVFTRDPSTGAKGLIGDFMVGAQGEDVVAGSHATLAIGELRSLWPDLATELDEAAAALEQELCDLADIEFTIEDGVLWLLQVRPGKRSPAAALRVAIDLGEDPAFPISRAEAVARVADILADPPTQASPVGDADQEARVVATGLAASPGRAIGRLCTDIDEAIAAGTAGEAIILVRRETSPSDIAGMAEAQGLVTSLGGLVSHAAVIARSWSIPAVVGATDVTVEPDGIIVDGVRYDAGTIITVDGDHGVVLLGDHPADQVEVPEVAILRRWQQAAEPTATPSGSMAAHGEPATVETCERVLALKGAASAATVAEVLGCGVDEPTAIIAQLIDAGSAQELPGGRVRLAADATARVDARFTADAARLGPAIEPHWEDFHLLDGRLKALVAAWQVRDADGEQVPNDHSDATYDAAIVSRLGDEVHPAIGAILQRVAAREARFGRYGERLEGALAALRSGDVAMMAHPFRDSYHTVWFELHEELIRLTGRTRADEAAAGRG